MSKPKFYDHWPSSASYWVWIMLNLAGIEYNTGPINLLTGDIFLKPIAPIIRKD